MPHLFLNRPRLYDLTKDQAELRSQFRWETINAVFYKLGGIVFIIGSVLFFPALSKYANLGAWTFFGGSLLYLVVTTHDLAEVRRHWRTTQKHTRDMVLEYTAAASYLWGTILFTVGSVFFLSYVDWTITGAWCFVIGSLLFVLGACVNVMQIVKADTMLTLQLMNYTAVTFVAGSILFTVASVPYLWHVDIREYEIRLHAFLAWQYLIGSVLFFAGGVFNYWRIYLFMRRTIREKNAH
ncbi:hypothetical protein DPQ33_15850 [Oceanidesulfovibrio indonesiensis]|uniref:YrhK domain-containing protein n=1 Tax=Oceanidesulfovibrio indonesiensis TaxID=54767 RepID=A0A7M3MAZ6_9BACT|nr:YrhK family protein [Oceanidesulfovibrio indonesiensis]TVM15167.1 hypothetical protein DPQ33_15850 [Oceanidesulfovibrio indonesiensis]